MKSFLFVGLAAFGAFFIGCTSETSGPPCDGADKYEGNDSPSAAKDLGDLTDDPDSNQALDLTAPGGSDVDFFRFRIFDKGIGGDPVVTVSGPEGYEITIWTTCARGNPINFSCSRGKEVEEASVIDGKGCQNIQPNGSVSSSTDCDADSDDDGTVLVRVRRLDTSNQCTSAYKISIEVE